MIASTVPRADVMQKDIFFSELTVREHLRCTATLRLPPSWSPVARAREFERIVSLLRLNDVLDSKVGGNTSRGISGGELKRLNIATELLARPQMLLLDEPLSGLDSTLAGIILGALAADADARSTTILLSVHQPSAAMWATFGKLMLMAPGGRAAYFGAAADAEAYVSAVLHVEKPADRSAPEYLIDLVSEDTAQRQALLEAFGAIEIPPDPSRAEAIVLPARPPLSVIVGALLRRNLHFVWREESKKLEWLLTVGLAIAFSGVFYQIGAERATRPSEYVNLLFFFVAHWSWHPLFKAMGKFPTQRDVLTRERAADSYPIGAWSLALFLAEWAFAWTHPLLFYVLSFPIAALPLQAFVPMFAIQMVHLEASMALGGCLAAAVFDGKKQQTLAIVVMVYCMMAGGFFVNLTAPGQPTWLSFISYTSYWKYSFGMFIDAALPEPGEAALFETALEKYSFSTFPAAINIAILVGAAAVLRVLAYVFVLKSKSLKFS